MDAAEDGDASLIVLGARGRSGLGGRAAGCVTGAVVSRSKRPC
jgi:nucleotide-binding universal stress UspA family protein